MRIDGLLQNLFPPFDTHSANETFRERAPSRKDGQITRVVVVDILSPFHLKLFYRRQIPDEWRAIEAGIRE